MEVQRQINFHHADGAVEAFKERAIRLVDTLASLIRIDNLPHSSFLDIGCRSGYVMDRFLTLYPKARVTGVDIVPEFVELAGNVSEAHVADAHELPFKDDEFDWVFSSQTLEHCYNVPKALDEHYRVAKSGVAFSLPLETGKEYGANPSHLAYTPSTFVWMEVLWRPGWDLLYAVLLGTEFVCVMLNSQHVYNDESGRLLNV